jgi:transposase
MVLTSVTDASLRWFSTPPSWHIDAVGGRPPHHYKTTTITAAPRTSGLCATALLDGPTNGTRFCSYVTETLVPVLQPGDLVVMDNLPAHKVAGVQDAIEAAGARLLYLPSCSPDVNPIEQVFAKLKAGLTQRGSPHDPGSLGGDPSGIHTLHSAGVPQLPRRSRLRERLGRRYLTGNSSNMGQTPVGRRRRGCPPAHKPSWADSRKPPPR